MTLPIASCVRLRCALALPMLAILAACATSSGDVAPLLTDPSLFTALDCDSLYDETDRVRQRAAEVAYALDERSGTNIVALGLGVTVFWPALVAMRPTGPDARELARLRGRDEALQRALGAKRCPSMPETLPAARAAGMPIAVGDRLVYEERAAAGGPARELRLTVSALRRHEVDFLAQDGGRETAWKRLLRPEMALGDVLSGELVSPQVLRDPAGRGRVRGQVIALGVKHSLGRPFDAAVIELYGEVPDGSQSARVDGVMVVDRKSGVLLRLELNSSNPEFALKRTLVRIEPPATAGR